MKSPLFLCLFDLRWWEHAVAVLVLTHVTIVGVTVFLRRNQARRAQTVADGRCRKRSADGRCANQRLEMQEKTAWMLRSLLDGCLGQK